MSIHGTASQAASTPTPMPRDIHSHSPIEPDDNRLDHERYRRLSTSL